MNAISIIDAIDNYLTIYATRIRPGTLALQRIYLRHFLDWITARRVFDLAAVTAEHIEAYRIHLGTVEYKSRQGMKRIAPSTRADRFGAVFRFFEWAVTARLLIVDPTVSIRRISRGRWRPRSLLTEAEVAAMLEVPDCREPIGMRDRALLEVFYSTGLRCAEVAGLDVGDVDLVEGVVFVRYGKGGKQRLVPIGESAVAVMKQYLTQARPLFVKRPGVRALFLASLHCGQTGNRLSRSAIRVVVEKAALKAGITRRVTPHTFRHSVSTHLLRAGADLRHVQELLGHSRIDMTERYTHLDVHDLAEAHGRSHPRGKS